MSLTRYNRTRNLNVGLESIDFQHDGFGNKLEVIFKEMIAEIKGDHNVDGRYFEKMHYRGMLQDLIFERLGIKTSIIFDTPEPGMILPFIMTEHHTLSQDWLRFDGLLTYLPEQKKLLKQAEGAKGTIDLKNAKVGGFFSQYSHDLSLNVTGVVRYCDFTSGQMTGILLHELGHAWSFFEFSDRLSQTNLVLQQMTTDILKNDDKDVRTHHLKHLIEINGFAENTFDDLMQEDNRLVFGMKLFERYLGCVKSNLPNVRYDDTASEQIADNFATRFGYGRDLITALDIFNNYDGGPEKSKVSAAFCSIKNIILMFFPIIGAIVALAGGGVAPLLVGSLICFGVMAVSGEDNKDYTYDETKLRYTRIKHQYIALLKDFKLDNEKVKNAVADIKRMDKIIEQTYQYRTPIDRLLNIISKRHRGAKESIDFQQLLEELAHNSLFMKAAELKTIH